MVSGEETYLDGYVIPSEVMENLDRLVPRGGERKIKFVTEESLKRTCEKCGRCCALSLLKYPMYTIEDTVKDVRTTKDAGSILVKNAEFIIKNWVQITDEEELRARGLSENDVRFGYFYSCKLLGKDNHCTVYEDRPLVCSIHPDLHQNVIATCVFADVDEDPTPPFDYNKFMVGTEKEIEDGD